MKTSKKLTLLGVGLIFVLFLSACGGDKVSVEDLQLQVQTLEEENQHLRNVSEGMAITEQTMQSSLQVLEGATTPEFVTIDQNIVFPNRLHLPDSNDDVNDSKIQVGSRFALVPSTNWLMKVNGSTLHFSHPSKIWGSVKAVRFSYMDIERESYRSILQPFFTDFPATNITYRKIYMGEWEQGLLARAEITVDKKPHVINVGFVISGDNALLFLFDYEDNQSGVQQELIDLLISSTHNGTVDLKLE